MMDLTTTARVKLLLGQTSHDEDPILGQIISVVSREAERYMGRELLAGTYVEYFDLEAHQRLVALKAPGTVTITSVYNDSYRLFGSTTLVDPLWYSIDENCGLLQFDYELVPGPRALKVTYTGGVATTVAGLIAAGYQDVVGAVDHQCVLGYRRAADPHLAGYSNPAGGVTLQMDFDWLPWVRSVLESRRIVRVVA